MIERSGCRSRSATPSSTLGVRHRLVELRDRRPVERRVELEVGERRDVLGARHRGVECIRGHVAGVASARAAAELALSHAPAGGVRLPGAAELEPRCPEGQPVLSRPRLTSSATPAARPRIGAGGSATFGRAAASPPGTARGPGTGTRRRTRRRHPRRSAVHFARYAVPFLRLRGALGDPGAERDLVPERRDTARGRCRAGSPGRSSRAARRSRAGTSSPYWIATPPCSRLWTSCAWLTGSSYEPQMTGTS